MSDSLWSLIAVAVLVFSNAFFVAAEFALVSIRRSRVDELASQGVSGAAAVKRVVHDLDRYIAGTQVGITLASLALGWLGEPALAHLIEPLFFWFPVETKPAFVHTVAVALAFIVITFLHVVFGELVPKSIALQKPEEVSLLVARPMMFVVWLFRPLIWSLNGVGNGLLRSVGMNPAGEHHGVHSVEELEIIVGQSHQAGVLDDLERQILQHTFRFSELTASQVMVPRQAIRALDLSKPVDQLLDEVTLYSHTRVPAFEGTLDNIVGIVYIHDLFRRIRQPGSFTSLRELCQPPHLIPEGVHLDAVLEMFKEQRTQIAIVVDEFGGTSGLITYEDIVEEVTGEVQDRYEPGEPPIQRTENGEMLVRGSLRLDELNHALAWNLEDEDSETVGGLVMNRLARVAQIGDEVETSFGTLRVTKMDKLRIVALNVLPRPGNVVAQSESDET